MGKAIELETKEIHDWNQRSEAVGQMIDELRTCFANIRASAQLLNVKMGGDSENPIREEVKQIIQVAERTEERLSSL